MGILGELTLFRPSPGTHGTAAWGSAFGAVFSSFVGAIAGLIAGLVLALTQIAQHDGQLWKRPTWLGIVAGVCLFIALQFIATTFDPEGLFRDLFVRTSWGAAALLAALGTMGGYAGGLVSIAIQSSSSGAKKKRRSIAR